MQMRSSININLQGGINVDIRYGYVSNFVVKSTPLSYTRIYIHHLRDEIIWGDNL